MTIGILSVQGAVGPHEKKFQQLGIPTRQVKTSSDLEELAGIVLPGGESSAMIHLLKRGNLWNTLKDFVSNRPTWGLCAGTILLAKSVLSPSQDSLAALNIEVTRNAYGRQSESFISALTPTSNWIDNDETEGVFIRAPKITGMEASVKTLFTFSDQPVMVQQGFTLASTFHPELSDSLKLHNYFAKICEESF